MADIFASEYDKLNQAQQHAVDTIDGPVLVIAGPGTGKTQLLGMRVANILRRTDVNASNILCLTFTESGALSIQRRLQQLIGEAGNKVSVHTFHGFGRAVIGTNPEVFYDSATARAADDLTLFEVLFDLFEHLPHANPLASYNGEEFIFLKDVQSRISQLKTAGLTPDQLSQQVSDDDTWCQAASRLISETYQQFKRFDKKSIPLIVSLHQQLTALPAGKQMNDWLQPLSKLLLSDLEAALSDAETQNSTSPISQWKARWLEAADGKTVLKANAQHRKLETLAGLYRQYEAALHERKLYDYDDMILDVLTALKTQPNLRASLQEQYQYLLIDEYQDTSPAQAQLLDLLADNPVHEGRPNIMVVGDDDQTIFGFQGADANVMLHFRERWRDVVAIVLTENYRSAQTILDTARALITQGGGRLETIYPDIVKQLRANQHNDEPKPELVVFTTAEQQYSWLAEQLKKLPSDTTAAVIAPRHKYLARLLPHVAALGVGIHYERQTNVLNDPTTKRFLKIAHVINALSLRHLGEVQYLLPEVLSYSWWGVTVEHLWALNNKHLESRSSWLELMPEAGPELEQMAEWLVDLASEALNLPLEACLARISEYINDSVDSLSLNLHIGAIVRELELYLQDKPPSLQDFVRYVSLCQQAKLHIEMKQVADSGQQTVQLMTAHKSKGLEFSYVFLIDATQHIWLQEKGMINKVGLPPNLAFIQPAGETADDRLRLLYVAATRAKQKLTITTRLEDGTKANTLLSWLEPPHIKQTMHQWHGPEVAITQTVVAAQEDDWRSSHHRALNKPAFRLLLEDRLTSYRLSPTHLTTFLDVGRGGPRQFLVQHLLGFKEAPTVTLIYGDALHRSLEQAQKHFAKNGALPDNTTIREFFNELLASHSLRQVDTQKLLERGQQCLERYLHERANGFTSYNLAEYSFAKEGVALGEARLTGKLDRLWLDKATHQAAVTDFKTGRAFPSWNTSADYDKHKLHKYKQQLGFYKLLVENSTHFSDYVVKDGFLDFVEADKWGKLQSLHYDYNSDEQARLVSLITAVWGKIMALDLPDTSNYSPDFKGIRQFEQDLLDGKV